MGLPKFRFAAALLLISALTLAAASAAGFPDVPADAWYAPAVEYVSGRGLMTGTDKGFEPEADFSRAQVATVFYRLAEEPAVTGDLPFTDAKTGKWYSAAVLWADRTRLLQGYGHGLFGPDDPVTQEQLVTILWRYAGEPEGPEGLATDVDPWYQGAVAWARSSGLVGEKLGYSFSPGERASRAQVAALLYRFLGGDAAAQGLRIQLEIGDRVLTALPARNTSAEAFLSLLSRQPITLSMSDYGGFEKGAPLPQTLPRNDERLEVDAGDVVLYQGRQLVLAYDTNVWSLTPLGKLEGITKSELQALLGDGNVTVRFSVARE